MKGIVNHLPPYQFLIAFSQLISRICHPNSDVFTLLEVSFTSHGLLWDQDDHFSLYSGHNLEAPWELCTAGTLDDDCCQQGIAQIREQLNYELNYFPLHAVYSCWQTEQVQTNSGQSQVRELQLTMHNVTLNSMLFFFFLFYRKDMPHCISLIDVS